MNPVEALRASLRPLRRAARPAALAEVDARALPYPIGSGESDEIALRCGLRPLFRQLLSPADVARTRTRLEAAGFVTALSPDVYGATRDGFDRVEAPLAADAPEARQALFVGRERARVEAAVAADVALDDLELGRLLGYPRCCVEAFVRNPRPRRNVELHRSSLAGTRARPAPRLNMLDLRLFHLVSWSPCGFDCALSLRYADALAERIAARWPEFLAQIERSLAAHRLLLLDEVQLSFDGVFDGERLRIARVWPTARDYDPRLTLAPEVRDATALLLELLRGIAMLRLRDATLVLDERRELTLDRPPLLVPFGAWASSAA